MHRSGHSYGYNKRGAPHEEGHPVRHSTPQHQSTSVKYLKIYLRSSNDVQDLSLIHISLEIKQKLELNLSVQPQSHHTHIHTKIRATSARKVQLSDGPLEPSI